jgi:hypothetical protein
MGRSLSVSLPKQTQNKLKRPYKTYYNSQSHYD